MATEHTRLIYVTTGVLLWKLVQTKSLTEYTHIFVDEVPKHEADWCMLLKVSYIYFELTAAFTFFMEPVCDIDFMCLVIGSLRLRCYTD